MTMPAPLEERDVRDFLARVVDLSHGQAREGSGRLYMDVWRHWRGQGLRPGDIVLLALPNGSELLTHFFAVLAAGGVPLLVAPHTPSVRIQALVESMHVRAVASVRLPVRLTGWSATSVVGRQQVGRLRAAGEPAACPGQVVLMTSGTSGFASGCVFDLDALLRNAARHAGAVGQRSGDTVLVNLPLHFSFSLVAQALATLVTGGKLVVGGPPFHVPSYLQAVQIHKVTMSSLTPVLARDVLARDGVWPDSLRVLTVGGDVLPEDHVRQLLERRPGKELYVTYGLTQAGPRVSTLAAHKEPSRLYGTAGLPLEGVQVRLAPVPGRAEQQLLVSSDTLMQRRIGRMEDRSVSDWYAPGILATGDLFRQDDDGYLTFCGRLSDFIVRRGDKICLASVRRIACELPRVARARTRVSRDGGGEARYTLILRTRDAVSLSAREYRSLLARVLRITEMPDRLEFDAAYGTVHHK